MHNELKEGIDEIRARLCPDEQEEDEEKESTSCREKHRSSSKTKQKSRDLKGGAK